MKVFLHYDILPFFLPEEVYLNYCINLVISFFKNE